MKEQILIILAILPVAIICKYIYEKDKEKESKRLLFKLLLSGMLSAILVIIISLILSALIPYFKLNNNMSFIQLLFQTFIKIALLEESMKLLMVYLFGYKSQEFDETYDIIIYSVFVSLGFAAFENIAYILTEGSIVLSITRGILSVPAHAFDALFMGYYLSLAKISQLQNNKKLEKNNLIKSIIVPTLLHGIYDFCLYSENSVIIIFFIFYIVFLYIVSINKLKYVIKNNSKLKQIK